MRLAIIGAALPTLLGTVVAQAQEASVFDQYQSAMIAFGGDAGDSADIRAQITQELDGKWFPIGALQPPSDDAELFAMACEKSPQQISVRNSVSFEITRTAPKGSSVATIYTARAGREFGSYSDPEAVATWLGIDMQSANPALDSLLATLNGTAIINRPSPDILVIQKDGAETEILARCAD